MKRILCSLMMIFLLAVGRGAGASPPIPPAPSEWVTDTADFLSKTTRQTLNARLEAYERDSGHQVLVWVGKTTGQTPLEDWTARAFQSWRVGRAKFDDGLVLFLFAEDRTARIEVGYGLEAQVPDATASRLLREVLLPRIKAGDHDGAVTAGVDHMLAALGTDHSNSDTGDASAPSGLQIVVLVLLGVGLIALAIRYPGPTLYLLSLLVQGGGGGNGGFGGRGGRSGGGGASGKW